MSNSTGQSGNGDVADTRTDPAMKALYHMSRTAGVGLGDYAAVNVLSVIGLIIGIACFLLLIFDESYLLLILPASALIVSFIAIWQIRDSNGTQVGNGLAAGGMALALIFGGINITQRVRAASAEARDRAEIEQLVVKLSSAATTQSTVPQGYELFHKRFKEQVNPETFARTIAFRTGLLANSPIAGISLGKNVLFETNAETKVTTASALIVLTAKQADEQGNPLTAEYPAAFRRDGDAGWTIYAIPDWFGKEETPGG
jgi:hypothetical protein